VPTEGTTSSSPATSTSLRDGRQRGAASEQRGGSALVEVRLAALGADLRLGGADGPQLRQRPLPYPVPLDVTAPA
jgi:hypothetical protein